MKVSQARYEIDMTQGPLLHKILLFSVPLMLSGSLQLLYNAADIAVVGNFSGSTALAAVSSTSSLINLIVTLFIGLSVGVNVCVSTHYGAGRAKEASQAVHTAIAISLIAGVGAGIFGLFAARKLLTLMGSPEDVIDQATLYLTIYFTGLPASMLYNFGAAVLRAIGDTRRPLYYLTISGLINVGLNLLTVICFRMGVAGVAIATVSSQVISAVLVLICLVRSHGVIQLNLKGIRIFGPRLKEIARVGIPAGLQGMIFSASNVLIQSSVNSFGSAVMAGNGAGQNLDGFLNIATNSVAQAGLAFSAQNVGAGKYRRVGRVLLVCLLLAVCIGLGLGLLLNAFARPLLRIYSNEAAVIENGVIRMRIMCLTYFLCAVMDVFANTIRGTGHSVAPMLVTALGVVGIRLGWLFFVFPSNRTLEVLYYSYPVSWIATSLVHAVCFIFIYRKLLKRAPPPPR